MLDSKLIKDFGVIKSLDTSYNHNVISLTADCMELCGSVSHVFRTREHCCSGPGLYKAWGQVRSRLWGAQAFDRQDIQAVERM